MQSTGGWRVLAPFCFREYRLLIGALSISIFAEGMWAVTMAMQVIALDDDPASLSLVATCLGAGLVGFVLVGGITADRINQRTIITAVQSINITVVTSVAVLSSFGTTALAHGSCRSDSRHRGGLLLPFLQRPAAADPARRPTAGGQWRRRRGAPGLQPLGRPGGRSCCSRACSRSW